jgi:YbgC/YbaW family acyl-CoA thioester hydrolase
MTTLKKLLESSAKIRFPDCDPFNHLNNSKYIDYMINAREDQLVGAYNFDLYRLAVEKKIGWVSAQTQISYLSPARLMEEVTIQTRLLSATQKSLLVEALMWNKEKTALKSVMWAKLVHYNLATQKSQLHSDELLSFFQEVVYPLPGEMNFEERVASLRTSLKPQL